MFTTVVLLIVVALLGILYLWIKTSRGRGAVGETAVAAVLKTINGKIYSNYVITDKNGNTHQIDHIFVNNSGLYVIEVKTYSGKIYGKDDDRYWRQSLAYGNTVNKFYNPVKQNLTHCYEIKEIVPRDVRVNSLVVFVGADISAVDSAVTLELERFRSYLTNRPDVLSDEQTEEINRILEENRERFVSNREHVRNIRRRRDDIEKGICPRCGGRLVLRNGKYGDFYGCENYPRCTFKKKL